MLLMDESFPATTLGESYKFGPTRTKKKMSATGETAAKNQNPTLGALFLATKDQYLLRAAPGILSRALCLAK